MIKLPQPSNLVWSIIYSGNLRSVDMAGIMTTKYYCFSRTRKYNQLIVVLPPWNFVVLKFSKTWNLKWPPHTHGNQVQYLLSENEKPHSPFELRKTSDDFNTESESIYHSLSLPLALIGRILSIRPIFNCSISSFDRYLLFSVQFSTLFSSTPTSPTVTKYKAIPFP